MTHSPYRMMLFITATLALAGGTVVTSAAAEPKWVRSEPTSRGTTTGVQYFLESAIEGKTAQFVRIVVIQDRPDDYANYNRARIPGDSQAGDLRTITLAHEPLVGSSGVREVIAVYMPETVLRASAGRLDIVIDGAEETLKIGISQSHIKGFLKRLDAATG